MNKSAGMRRVRRAAGAAAFDAAVSARDDYSSVGSDKYAKFNAARAKEIERAGSGADDSDQLPLLSEKLRLTEQQPQNNNRRGPMMDSDHSSRAAPSSGNSIGSLQRMHMVINAASKGGDRNRFPQLQKKKMNMVLSAFGESPRLFRRIKKVMKCTKDDADDLDPLNQSPVDSNPKRKSTSKMIFAMVFALLIVFNLGRRKGREKEKESLSLNNTLNNQKLRGPPNGNSSIVENSGNINQAAALEVVFPFYFSSLSNLTEEFRPGEETPYFWDVHFSGESIAEAIFAQCYGLVMAENLGFDNLITVKMSLHNSFLMGVNMSM